MRAKVGDVFIIDDAKQVCKTPDKKFTIDSFTKSGIGVVYYDKRTNNSCKCRYCTGEVDLKTYTDPKTPRRISVLEITIIETKEQYQRNLKLKSLLR